VDATKQVFIETLPPVLVLHMKRFLYDAVGGVQKSNKAISYKTILEIPTGRSVSAL
jgi:ubiquitin carboxyl-terminal hydrolase 10